MIIGFLLIVGVVIALIALYLAREPGLEGLAIAACVVALFLVFSAARWLP